jgi:hypothetical protein
MLGVPLGTGTAHVVAFGPVGVEQASQHPREIGKIAGKTRAPAVGACLSLSIGGLHGEAHCVGHARNVRVGGRAENQPGVLGPGPGCGVAPSRMPCGLKVCGVAGQSCRTMLLVLGPRWSAFPLGSIRARHADATVHSMAARIWSSNTEQSNAGIRDGSDLPS